MSASRVKIEIVISDAIIRTLSLGMTLSNEIQLKSTNIELKILHYDHNEILS